MTQKCNKLNLTRCLIRKRAIELYNEVYGDEDHSEEEKQREIDEIAGRIIDREVFKGVPKPMLKEMIYENTTEAEKLALDYFAAKKRYKGQNGKFKQALVELVERWSTTVEDNYDEYVDSVLEKLGQVKELYERHLKPNESKNLPLEKKKGIRARLRSSSDKIFKVGVAAFIVGAAAYIGLLQVKPSILGSPVINGFRDDDKTYESIKFYDKEKDGGLEAVEVTEFTKVR
jgi:hypothetical protein